METLRPKRQKVTTACEPCRGRKIKCDGHRPVCGPCKEKPKSEAPCSWATESLRILHVPADYIRRLEDRISLLERRNSQGHQIQLNNSQSISSALEESIPGATSRHGATSSTLPEPIMMRTSVPLKVSSFISTAETSTDLRPSTLAAFINLGLVSPLQEPPKSTDTIFPYKDCFVHDVAVDDNHNKDSVGSPIVRNFMQEVERIVTEKLGGASQPASSILNQSHDDPLSVVPSYKSRQKDLDYTLPTREQADSLLSSYWNCVHVLYPFLDKSQVEEDYDKIWKRGNSISDRQSFLCLLNSIFAVSSQQIRSVTLDREHLAATFSRRARDLLDIEACSIRSIQSYLLLVLYFRSINQPRTCEMFVGLAIRTAHRLELQLLKTSERESESQIRDMLCKVWHGCVLMDREVSMLYDRLCMIDPETATAVPLPLIMEEENLQLGYVGSQTSQARQSHTTDFYISSLGLYDILYDVLINFYSSKSQRHFKNGRYDSENFLSFETNPSVVELQERLSKWEKRIPDYYKIGHHSPYNGTNSVLVRRAVVLHQRHLHVHLLLLRPMLQSFVASEFRNKGESVPLGSLLSYRISLQCTIVCVKIAQEAIDTIHVGETAGLNEIRDLSAWWHNAILLYKSATVLIAGSLSPSVVAEVSKDSIHDGFNKAIAVLTQYTTFNASIRRLTTVLHILFKIIPQKYSRLRQASQRIETDTDLPTSDDANIAATFQYWCPVKTNRYAPSPPHEPKVHSKSEDNNRASSQLLLNLDRIFDLDDFTWLMKLPFCT